MEAQRKIGWNNFELGVIANKWGETQAHYLKTEEDMSNRQIQSYTTKWETTIQEFLWKFISALWEHICQFIHGTDKASNYRNTRI